MLLHWVVHIQILKRGEENVMRALFILAVLTATFIAGSICLPLPSYKNMFFSKHCQKLSEYFVSSMIDF